MLQIVAKQTYSEIEMYAGTMETWIYLDGKQPRWALRQGNTSIVEKNSDAPTVRNTTIRADLTREVNGCSVDIDSLLTQLKEMALFSGVGPSSPLSYTRSHFTLSFTDPLENQARRHLLCPQGQTSPLSRKEPRPQPSAGPQLALSANSSHR